VNHYLGSVKRAITAGALFILIAAPTAAAAMHPIRVETPAKVDRHVTPARLKGTALHPLTFEDWDGPVPARSTASPAAVMHGTKRICHADTVTVRASPGGRTLYTLRRGQIFEVVDKRDGVWLYGFGHRGYGYVLGQYLCKP